MEITIWDLNIQANNNEIKYHPNISKIFTILFSFTSDISIQNRPELYQLSCFKKNQFFLTHFYYNRITPTLHKYGLPQHIQGAAA